MSKLYQLICLSMSCIIQEIDKLKHDEDLINYELMLLSYRDPKMEQFTKKIEKPKLPTSVSCMAGFINLTENGEQTPLRLGMQVKRCHNRLKKERTDLEYLHQVQNELLSMKSNGKPIHGTQELNNVNKSLVDRIKHGSNNLRNEHKILHEIEKINETIEIYSEPTQPVYRRYYFEHSDRGKRIPSQLYNYNLQRTLKEHIAKVRRLKADRDQVRKSFRHMERALDKFYKKIKKVYNIACKHEEQNIQESSINNEYELLMKKVKELARNGDVVGLMQIFDSRSTNNYDYTRISEEAEVNVFNQFN
ncbi:uncharacterized protein [Rutidosis leptorrhynchoides]|uniref:uncharacterized protein n=1 Tax=Rutidosis leptorrhynchoides TaxID=125765 RepID=UPI003A99D175